MSDPPQLDVKRLLFEHVESFEDLEILAWFRRQPEGTQAEIETVAAQIGVPGVAVGEAMARLVKADLLVPAPDRVAFRYSPKDPAISALLDVALERYRTNPVEIMQIMTANAIERVRTAALRTFAECFRIRDPKSDA